MRLGETVRLRAGLVKVQWMRQAGSAEAADLLCKDLMPLWKSLDTVEISRERLAPES